MPNYTIENSFLPFADVSESQFDAAIARARLACKYSMPSGVGVPGWFANGSDVVKPDDFVFIDRNMMVVKGEPEYPRGIYVRYSEAPRDADGFPLYGAPRAHAFAKGTGDYWRLTVRL